MIKKEIMMVENDKITEIKIEWQGPFTLEKLKDFDKDKKLKNTNYGMYQIYGTHTVYGSHVLLYIGKVVRQTFAERILQEDNWFPNTDKEQIQIYIGRLFDEKYPGDDEWNELISKAEQLLIFSHWPAGNSSNINSITSKKDKIKKFKNIRIYNFDQHRNLMPEVSGRLYVEEFDFDEKYIFGSNTK